VRQYASNIYSTPYSFQFIWYLLKLQNLATNKMLGFSENTTFTAVYTQQMVDSINHLDTGCHLALLLLLHSHIYSQCTLCSSHFCNLRQ